MQIPGHIQDNTSTASIGFSYANSPNNISLGHRHLMSKLVKQSKLLPLLVDLVDIRREKKKKGETEGSCIDLYYSES